MPNEFIITGTVREKESGEGLEGLIVRSYDKDLLYDDLMGESITDCDGSFRIVSQFKDFRDFFDNKPDIYFKIFMQPSHPAAPVEIYNTLNAIVWNAANLQYIIVEIPHAIVKDLLSGSHYEHEDEHENKIRIPIAFPVERNRPQGARPQLYPATKISRQEYDRQCRHYARH